MDPNPFSAQFVDNAPCVSPNCDQTAIRQFKWSVGTKFCLCPKHSNEEIKKESYFDVFDQDKIDAKRKKISNKLLRSGIPEQMVGPLDILNDCIGIQNTEAVNVAAEHVKAENQGVLIFSGHNGVGKSFAGAFLAWRSRGRYLRKSDWSSLTTWSKDYDDIIEYRDTGGTLVFDEVLQNSAESPETIKALNMIACERHDLGRSTLLITRADDNEFYRVFGNDMLDRARQHSKERFHGSGFISLKGRSRR